MSRKKKVAPKARRQVAYMVITPRFGYPVTLDERFPIYWYQRTARQAASVVDRVVKVVLEWEVPA